MRLSTAQLQAHREKHIRNIKDMLAKHSLEELNDPFNQFRSYAGSEALALLHNDQRLFGRHNIPKEDLDLISIFGVTPGFTQTGLSGLGIHPHHPHHPHFPGGWGGRGWGPGYYPWLEPYPIFSVIDMESKACPDGYTTVEESGRTIGCVPINPPPTPPEGKKLVILRNPMRYEYVNIIGAGKDSALMGLLGCCA